jgi:squalene synthase HpnC
LADDLADENLDPMRNLAHLDWWEDELQACFAGRPKHPVFLALQRTVCQYAIPMKPFADLLVAFRRDQQGQEYESIEELLDYCRHSANPVGRLVLYLTGTTDAQLAHWSDSVCTGLQLANFWQDWSRDVQRGRIYLPREIRRTHGYTDAMLGERQSNERFRRMIRGEVDRAQGKLQAGMPLIRHVPSHLRIQIALFILGGIAVLDRIRDIDYDVWRVRPRLSRMDRVRVMGRALWISGCSGRQATWR